MDFVTFVGIYLGGAALLLLILLFGESPMFFNTPLPKVHWLLTSGLIEGLLWVVEKVGGAAGLNAVDYVLEICCERSNPFLQVVYLVLISGGYYLYWGHVFAMLPNQVVGEEHMWLGTACVCLCVVVFLAASLSDPGTITEATYLQYQHLYPHDHLLFTPVQCRTCKFIRPARSKHCSTCRKCVARHDHHCGWINNCVGLNNARLFLMFLACNLTLCLYGLVLDFLALMGDISRRGGFHLTYYDLEHRRRVLLYTDTSRFVQWILLKYPIPIFLGVFLAAAALLLGSFLGYHLYLLGEGRTTYETYKWRNIARERMNSEGAAGRAGWGFRGWLKSVRHGLEASQQRNIYNKGWRQNLFEVLRPVEFMRTSQGVPPRGDPAAAGDGPAKED